MTLEELETEVLKLNPACRARLAGKLLNSLETLSEAEVERLWMEEAERRNEQMERGVVEARRAEDVIRDAWARLG
ncbi:MAG: addiction module protein [Bryobacterales bacterium]|nr:addiction module protein [Bryobacterales bacterium]